VDAELFAGTGIRSSFQRNFGYGDASKVMARSPRRAFDKVCKLLQHETTVPAVTRLRGKRGTRCPDQLHRRRMQPRENSATRPSAAERRRDPQAPASQIERWRRAPRRLNGKLIAPLQGAAAVAAQRASG
jgi:hypothetical protein